MYQDTYSLFSSHPCPIVCISLLCVDRQCGYERIEVSTILLLRRRRRRRRVLLQLEHAPTDGAVFVPLRLRPAFNYSSDSNGIDRSNVRDTRVSFSRRRRCCYATTTATADAPARRTSIGAACHCSFPAGLVESQDLINQRNLPRLYLSPTTGSTGDPRRTGLRGSSAIYMPAPYLATRSI